MQTTSLKLPAVGARPKGHLLRVFGMAFALAIAIGTTIGGGILHTPGDIAALLPNVWLIMAVWLFGGINALLGATAFSELGAMIPCAGGPYVFARRALGDYAGFFVGYINWLQDCAICAGLALLIGEYSGVLLPSLNGHTTAVAFAVYGTLAAMQWHRVRWGGQVQTITTVAKTVGLGALVVAAFVLPHSTASTTVATPPLPHGAAWMLALVLALQGVFFTYNGYQYSVYFGEELRDPGREIPRSMFRGLAMIIVLYLLLNAAFLYVIPLAQLAHDSFAGGTVAGILFGERGDRIIRAIVIVSVLGVINTSIMSGPRTLLAMGRDRLFAHQATRVNAGGTPSVALLLSVMLGTAFLVSGTFTVVLQITVALMVVLYLLMFVSVWVLRWREPDTPRPYRAWGYPWSSIAGFAIGLVFLIGVAFGDPRHSLIALALLVASYPLYRGVVWLRKDTIGNES
ncbi:MAG: APC family permease [Rhodanobacteraceae bacterium]